MPRFKFELDIFGLELRLGAGLGTKKAEKKLKKGAKTLSDASKESAKRSIKAAEHMVDVTSDVVKDGRDVVAKGAKGTLQATKIQLGLEEE